MNFVITGVALLLFLAVGVLSCASAPLYERTSADNREAGGKAALMITPAAVFKKENRKQLAFVCCISVICSALAGFSYSSDAAIADLCRQIAAALTLQSAMIIDSKTRVIPNALILLSLGIGVLILTLEYILARDSFLMSFPMSIAGFICCIVLFYVLARLTKDGLGMGDVKLISCMGLLLGLSSTLVAVLLSLILCSAASVVLLLGKRKNKNDRIPFGPFLFAGYIFTWILFSF